MKIAFIGVGPVGAALTRHLVRLGHDVTVAARDPGSDTVKKTLAGLPGLAVAPIAEGVAAAELVFLATPFQASEGALRQAGPALDGKILVDCTNPIGPELTHALESKRSGAETLQAIVPQARVVKAFTLYGYENVEDCAYPGYGDLRPAMFIASDDAAAKKAVAELCHTLGWESVDAGALSSSLHLEHLALLWMKMSRASDGDAGFAWAVLRRRRK